MSPVEVRKLVTKHIIDDILPLTTEESPTFKKPIESFLPHPVELPGKAISHIEKAYESMMKKINGNLAKLPPQQMSEQFTTKVILE